MLRHAMTACGWAALLAATAALGQTAGPLPASPPLPPVQGSPGIASAPDTLLPPYEPQLERLAELMGTLSYLRDLCGQGDGAEWRRRMSALLDAEARTEARRERLAGAFNRGFRGYEATYRACTPSAELIIRRFIAEGDRLTRDLSTRYGGG